MSQFCSPGVTKAPQKTVGAAADLRATFSKSDVGDCVDFKHGGQAPVLTSAEFYFNKVVTMYENTAENL